MPDPYEIATWRFEQIAPLLDDTLSPAEQRRYREEPTTKGVTWPSGDVRPISRSTLYRWRKAYQEEGGLAGLLPDTRNDKGASREDRSEWVRYALGLVFERPKRSLTQLLTYVSHRFPEAELTRSTLYRELRKHPAYAAIERLRRGQEAPLKKRFQAKAPQELWQMDAKGPFSVRLADASRIRVHVLSILDDCTRYLLAGEIHASENLTGAVSVFRQAAARWGLPARIYCDRHSVYDSDAFRRGLAELGVRRVRSKPRNAPARGKIERYHRMLKNWFVEELQHQQVVDRGHLNELLQATLDLLYNRHHHRTLGMSPEEALAGRRSEREVTQEDLDRAFLQRKRKKTHPKTGEVSLPGGLFRVPRPYAGRRVTLCWDPVHPERAFLELDEGTLVPLEPAFEPEPPKPHTPKRGGGALQPLLDRWRGRELPLAPAGFGLPEIFAAFTDLLGRAVPACDREAEHLQAFYREKGPFDPEAFEGALEKLRCELGCQRPLQAYIDRLRRMIRPPRKEDDTP